MPAHLASAPRRAGLALVPALAVLLVTVLLVAALPGTGTAAAPEPVPGAGPVRPAVVAPPPPTREEADRAAALVTAEDRRLTEALRQSAQYTAPYRMTTDGAYTLTLTARPTPYTVEDLLALAPQTLAQQADGAYLLDEHLVVAAGATLRLARPGGLVLRLRSDATRFVTLAAVGGTLDLAGEPGAPVTITSWDPGAQGPDRDLRDGRAYVRVLGGQLLAQHLEARDLGFWSGRTGGLAVTGADRQPPGTGEAPPALDTVTIQPAGPLTDAPTFTYTLPQRDPGPSRVRDALLVGNAYGLFVSGADDVQVTDSAVRGSLVAGVVLHRSVTGSSIVRTTSTDNVGDGFSLDRATTGNRLRAVTASGNSGSGISLTGLPLADGPSPTGSTTTAYGDNAVIGSTVAANGEDGIRVTGGDGVRLVGNRISDSDMGIVVDGPSAGLVVRDNTVLRTARHGIAVLGGVTGALLSGNTVDGVGTGVYVRDSRARVLDNAVRGAAVHGVSLVGAVDGTEVARNVLDGTGTRALDDRRASGPVTAAGNSLHGWGQESAWYDVTGQLRHPMNALWAVVALVTVVSAVRTRRTRHEVAHPYAHQSAHTGPVALPDHRTARQRAGAPDRVIDLTDEPVAASSA